METPLFDAAVKRFRSMIFEVARSFTIQSPGLEIDDLMQEGLLVLLTVLEKYGHIDPKELSGLLFNSVRNRYIDLIRAACCETRSIFNTISIEEFHDGNGYDSGILHHHTEPHNVSCIDDLLEELIPVLSLDATTVLFYLVTADEHHFSYTRDGKPSRSEIAGELDTSVFKVYRHLKEIRSGTIKALCSLGMEDMIPRQYQCVTI